MYKTIHFVALVSLLLMVTPGAAAPSALL